MTENPWTRVELSDYENHMKLADVYQLQTLDKLMGLQFGSYDVGSIAILGIAGGNGLQNLIGLESVGTIVGIDINQAYLEVCEARYPELAGRFRPLLADLNADCDFLPQVDMVVANLFIEYVGSRNFAKAIGKMSPSYVSCIIQIDPAECFVSESPYAEKLGVLDSVHEAVDACELENELGRMDYRKIFESKTPLPNGKIFHRIDFFSPSSALSH